LDDVATRFRDLEAAREPLYWYLNMRRAGTMGGPFLLRRLSGLGDEPLRRASRPGAPVPPILPPQDGFLFLDKDAFPSSFAADVNPDLAAFMADSQVPWGVNALAGAITEPAWRTKPSWYLVATEDRMIPPDAQRFMSQRANATVVETAASHAVYVSRPEPVAAIIETAIKGVS
jgi:pimeloyl-ACP methyl ester carboxylesterase